MARKKKAKNGDPVTARGSSTQKVRFTVKQPLQGRVTYLTVNGRAVRLNRGTEPVGFLDETLPVADQELLKEIYEAGYTQLVDKQ